MRVAGAENATQNRIELARALSMEPGLVQVNQDLGVAILPVEHDMKMVRGIPSRVCVLNFGQRIALGKPAEVIRDEAVVAAYLGAA
ncbi:Branched-chain amino acid ATP-binding cassette transporter [Prescottella defluvii]